MLELLQRLRPSNRDATITQEVAELASREREVRTLETLIEYISSLEDEELAQAWPRLIGAVYAAPPTRGIAPETTQQADPQSMPNDD